MTEVKNFSGNVLQHECFGVKCSVVARKSKPSGLGPTADLLFVKDGNKK